MTRLSEGTACEMDCEEVKLELYRSGINDVSVGMFDTGFFQGRLFSSPINK